MRSNAMKLAPQSELSTDKTGKFPSVRGQCTLAVGRPMGEAGVQAKGKFTIGSLIVE